MCYLISLPFFMRPRNKIEGQKQSLFPSRFSWDQETKLEDKNRARSSLRKRLRGFPSSSSCYPEKVVPFNNDTTKILFPHTLRCKETSLCFLLNRTIPLYVEPCIYESQNHSQSHPPPLARVKVDLPYSLVRGNHWCNS